MKKIAKKICKFAPESEERAFWKKMERTQFWRSVAMSRNGNT